MKCTLQALCRCVSITSMKACYVQASKYVQKDLLPNIVQYYAPAELFDMQWIQCTCIKGTALFLWLSDFAVLT